MTFIVQNVGLLEQIITVFSDAKVYIWAKIYSIYFSNIFLTTKKKTFLQQILYYTMNDIASFAKNGGGLQKIFFQKFFLPLQKVKKEDREENLI